MKTRWLRLRVVEGIEFVDDFPAFMNRVKLGTNAVVRVKGKYYTVIEFELGEDYLDHRISELLERYPKQTQFDIQTAVDCFKMSRKGGGISKNIIRKVLTLWQRFSVGAVTEGVQIYISLPDHREKPEAYCTGIIRRLHKNDVADPIEPKAQIAPGSQVASQAAVIEGQVTEEFRKRGGGNLTSAEEASVLLYEIRQELA